jgi:translation initiation factor IF-1
MSAPAGRPQRVEGVIAAQLPSGLYRVDIDGGHVIVAHASTRIDRNFVRLLVGDRVTLELMRRDPTRARITGKKEERSV